MSSLEFGKYARKPFVVTAVQVTSENLDEVAEWCNGEVRREESKPYVSVPVTDAKTDRQTKAYIGDWVLYTKTAYKVYARRAFEVCFEPLKKNKKPEEHVSANGTKNKGRNKGHHKSRSNHPQVDSEIATVSEIDERQVLKEEVKAEMMQQMMSSFFDSLVVDPHRKNSA